MSKVFQCLGDEVENKDGDKKKVRDILGEGKVVALYFSAHWCPPCRNFTPKLAEFYQKVKASSNGDKFDVIFVSSDKEKGAFSEYLSEMPWWALPFEKRDEKAKLSKLFQVQGIPTLILLNGESGKIINKNGRSVVGSDPTGKNFPWQAKTLHDILKESEFITKNGDTKSFEQDIKGKILGIYFSAHWCPPCKAFTPKLCKVYDLLKKDQKNFEVVFVSSDQNEAAFKEYFKEMPFLAVPFDNSDVKDELSELYDIEGIPTLIIADKDGQVITLNGRAVVSADEAGKKFPWEPEPVEELNGVAASKINETPCLIYLPGEDEERFDRMKKIMQPIGEQNLLQAKTEQTTPDLYCLVAPPQGNDIVRSLCDYIGVDAGKESLFILNVPSAMIYPLDEQQYTKEIVDKFVKDFRDETLIGKSLQN